MFPGGMGVKRFLNEAWRNGMYDMQYDEAAELRSAWFEAFPEMEYHMQPTECGPAHGGDSNLCYTAHTITGRVRRYCSYNSACNFPFQGLAADGAKVALWNLVINGFKIMSFIHDEVLLEVREDQLDEQCKLAEKIMIDSMKDILPDVKIGAEAAAMIHWDKGAEPLYDANGKLVIWQPSNK